MRIAPETPAREDLPPGVKVHKHGQTFKGSTPKGLVDSAASEKIAKKGTRRVEMIAKAKSAGDKIQKARTDAVEAEKKEARQAEAKKHGHKETAGTESNPSAPGKPNKPTNSGN